MDYDTAEALFDLTWQYSLWHDQQSEETKERIMDKLGGSRAIFYKLFVKAKEFQEAHQGKDWWDTHDYYEMVDTWGEALIASIIGDIM